MLTRAHPKPMLRKVGTHALLLGLHGTACCKVAYALLLEVGVVAVLTERHVHVPSNSKVPNMAV